MLHIQVRRAVLDKAEMSVKCWPSAVPARTTDLTSLHPCFFIVTLLHTRILSCHLYLSHQGGQVAGGMNLSSGEIDFGNKARPRWMMWLCSACAYTGTQCLSVIGVKTPGGRASC